MVAGGGEESVCGGRCGGVVGGRQWVGCVVENLAAFRNFTKRYQKVA